MRFARRSTRPALLVSAALLLSACGIPTTGVVESGAPATGLRSPTLIYFVKNGVPIPVPRRTSGEVDLVTTLRMLLQGPDGEEQRAGVTTAIPPLKLSPKIWSTGTTEVGIQLPPVTKPLSDTAFKQLICTAAHTRHTQDPHVTSVQVTITYSSGDAGVWRTGTSGGGCSLATSDDAARPSIRRGRNDSAPPVPGGGAGSRPAQATLPGGKADR